MSRAGAALGPQGVTVPGSRRKEGFGHEHSWLHVFTNWFYSFVNQAYKIGYICNVKEGWSGGTRCKK